jgi:DNA-binding GntR family transcriptional regulator
MFERKPLRHHVQQEILARLTDQRLPAGTRINESHLAATLGVSRTPLREAMLGLAATGFLDSDLGRGFLVPPLSAAAFAEAQAVLGRLAPAALAEGLPVPSGRIMELSNLLGRARLKAGQPGQDQPNAVAELIVRWSALAIAGCPNRTLVAEVQRLEAWSRRYWYAAVGRGFAPITMLTSYAELYELLRSNRGDAAVTHWAGHIATSAAEAARHLPDLS